jgi:hypothetical protein
VDFIEDQHLLKIEGILITVEFSLTKFKNDLSKYLGTCSVSQTERWTRRHDVHLTMGATYFPKLFIR